MPPSRTITSEDEPLLTPTVELRLRRLEVASRYLLANLLSLPFVIVGIAVMFAQWHGYQLTVTWGVITCAIWLGSVLILRGFLKDENRARSLDRWTVAVSVSIAATSIAVGMIIALFWVDGDRLNNVLLYTILSCCIACAGAQSATSIPVLCGNLIPYALLYLYTALVHETYPSNIGIAFLQLCYFGLVATYARSVWLLADEMLRLRMDKRDLIDQLQASLVETSAAQRRAEAANNAKSEFLANMSHELRTPLNAVLGFSEIIKEKVFGNDAFDRYVDYASHIHFSGKHLLGLINDILDLSKIEAGKRELDESDVDLVAVVRDVLHFVEPPAARKNLTLTLEAPPEAIVRGDERALRQIIANLLSNAVKFTPQAGRVTVRLNGTPDGGISLAVIDTGIGIKPEELSKVLESFGQARHDIATTDERGTGLGLPIVKGLIELHSGSLKLESSLGKGTTVTIQLPAQRVLQSPVYTSAA